MTRGIERTFPRPFSETFRISKNEDFNGPYLENENEFLKNSIETVFRASKSCDRDQLVSAFQLTFKLTTKCLLICRCKIRPTFISTCWAVLLHPRTWCPIFLIYRILRPTEISSNTDPPPPPPQAVHSSCLSVFRVKGLQNVWHIRNYDVLNIPQQRRDIGQLWTITLKMEDKEWSEFYAVSFKLDKRTLRRHYL